MSEKHRKKVNYMFFGSMAIVVILLLSFLIPSKKEKLKKKEGININEIAEKSKEVNEEIKKEEEERINELIEGKKSEKPLVISVADCEEQKIIKENLKSVEEELRKQVDFTFLTKEEFRKFFENTDLVNDDLLGVIDVNKVSNIVYNRNNNIPELKLEVYGNNGFFIACEDTKDYMMMSHNILSRGNYIEILNTLIKE